MKAGIKAVTFRANGSISPISFEVQKADGMRYMIWPTQDLLALPDDEFKRQALLKFARYIAEDLGAPSNFYLDGPDLMIPTGQDKEL